MVSASTMIFTDSSAPPGWLDRNTTVNNRKWIVGRGPIPAKVMFIGEHPDADEVSSGEVFTSAPGQVIYLKARQRGVSLRDVYFTNVIKFMPRGKNPSTEELKLSLPLLEEEIRRVNPELIVCVGTQALRAVMGKGYALTSYHGTVQQHPSRPGTRVFATFSPAYVMHRPEAETEYESDWSTLSGLMLNREAVPDETKYAVLRRAADVRAFREWALSALPDPLFVIDCEWDGEHHMDACGYLRTVQVGYAEGCAVIIELFDETGRQVADNEPAIFAELKLLLEDPKSKLVGHHIRADGKWLLAYGIDIRKTTVYDTMVAEHTINSTGPFGLEALTVKYTNLGRYDQALMDWVNKHPAETQRGYGKVPSELLLPYAAKDVDAPRRIMKAQEEALRPFTVKRGKYPSLWEAELHTAQILYELEWTGMRVDKVRLAQVTDLYQTRRNELEGQLVAMASALGFPDFNFRSPQQVTKLLFDKLDMTPIRTTSKIPWERVMFQMDELQDDVNPTTDKETLSILADKPGADPIIGVLRDIRKVEYVCKQWLVEPEEAAEFSWSSRGGGLLAKLWPDGKLHANFSQLKETGRFSSSRPNVQNWLKRAEGELKRIIGKAGVERVFGAGAKFPTLRSVVVPEPGYVFMEGDWKQAEMFCLAALSGDRTMWGALNTPGKDLHDLTAITAFDINVFGQDGQPMRDDVLLALAANDPKWEDDDSPFKKLLSTLIYVDQRGRRLTRKEFKDGLRVSAKSLNFGIPYGRGALAIAIQVKAETGTSQPIQTIELEVQEMMGKWKSTTYPDAWRYMQDCAHAVVDPTYLTNPWGRVRRFPFPPLKDRDMIAKLGRESQNFPIQSTVADTCLITLWLMAQYRKDRKLGFRIVNQIHDAILLEVPEDEIDATRQMFYDTMGDIEIPIPNKEPLRLGVDVDVMSRWGEKQKK